MIESHVYLLKNNEWVDMTDRCYYPININHTLDESLDSGTVRYYIRTEAGNVVDPAFSKLKVILKDDDGTVTTEYFYYTDSFEQKSAIRGAPLYVHTLQLVEPTKILERYFISGMSVTQPLTGTKRTVWDVVSTLLDTNPLHLVGRPAVFVPDSAMQTRLAVESPEFKFSCKMTLWEALYDIGRYIGAVPRLKPQDNDDKVWNVVTWEFYGEPKGTIEELIGCAAMKSFDEVQACSELETYAENLIGSDEGMSSVTEPAVDGWITPRSEEIKLDNDNAIIPTQYPIYKFVKLILKEVYTIWYDVHTGESRGPDTIRDIDLTPYVYEQTNWELLGNTYFDMQNYKGNIIRYVQSNKNIIGLSYQGNLGSENAIQGAIRNALYIRGYALHNPKSNIRTSIIDMQFRIEYIPLLPAKITVVKCQKQEEHNALAFNQQAEVYDARALGRNMWGKVQSLGILTSKYLDKYHHWNEIPKIGDAFGDMIVTNVNAELRGPGLAVAELFLSQNYNRISEYVNVNSKYRQWAIPGDGFVERNLHYQNFLVIDDKQDCDNFLESFEMMNTMYSPFSLGNSEYPSEIVFATLHHTPHEEVIDGDTYEAFSNGALFSCQSMAIGNSLMFNWRAVDNLSAGVRAEGNGGDMQSVFVPYCKDDGTFEDGRIALGNRLSDLDAKSLPKSFLYDWNGNQGCNLPLGLLWHKIFHINKDPAEILSFTYQIHFVSNLSSIIIGEGLSQHHCLVSGKNQIAVAHRWKLRRKISRFTQILTDLDGEIEPNIHFSFEGKDNNFRILKITGIPENCVGWAFTDDENRLILAENTNFGDSRLLYLNFKEKR